MKQRLSRYFLLLCIPMLYAQELRSQNQFADAAGERVQACTDRTLYVCGEKVCFTAIIAGNGGTVAKELSKVLYCELITPDGNKILGRKFPLQHNVGQGCVTIPEETVSGIYFLRFYTRFMRNLNPGEYKYIMLKIVNPLKPEVLVSKKMADSAAMAGLEKHFSSDDERLEVRTTKMSFSPREEIRVSINAESGSDTLQSINFFVKVCFLH